MANPEPRAAGSRGHGHVICARWARAASTSSSAIAGRAGRAGVVAFGWPRVIAAGERRAAGESSSSSSSRERVSRSRRRGAGRASRARRRSALARRSGRHAASRPAWLRRALAPARRSRFRRARIAVPRTGARRATGLARRTCRSVVEPASPRAPTTSWPPFTARLRDAGADETARCLRLERDADRSCARRAVSGDMALRRRAGGAACLPNLELIGGRAERRICRKQLTSYGDPAGASTDRLTVSTDFPLPIVSSRTNRSDGSPSRHPPQPEHRAARSGARRTCDPALEVERMTRARFDELLAVIEEHADETATPIDIERVDEAFEFACGPPRRPACARPARTSSSTRSRSRRSAPACASTPRRSARRCCTTRSRTRAPALDEVREQLRRGDRRARRRRHQADRDHLPEPRRGARPRTTAR